MFCVVRLDTYSFSRERISWNLTSPLWVTVWVSVKLPNHNGGIIADLHCFFVSLSPPPTGRRSVESFNSFYKAP